MKATLKNDKYKKVRGGRSKLFDISCANCGKRICVYQKDGPGMLKRVYLDRIYNSPLENSHHAAENDIPKFICPNCGKLLGVLMTYKKESRFAYRLIPGAIIKKTS